MSTTLRIPKQSDREVIATLARVRDQLKPLYGFWVQVHPIHAGGIRLDGDKPEEASAVKYIVDLNSRVIPTLQLAIPNGPAAVNVSRKHEQVYDEATVTDDWFNNIQPEKRAELYVRLLSLLQKEFRCDDLNATFSGHEDTAWNRFRKAQTEILNSLEQTNQHLLVDTAKQIEANRAAELRKNDELRERLQKEFDVKKAELDAQIARQQQALRDQEEALRNKLAHYETHEALYVARQKNQEQLNQLKDWLKDSSLTTETVKKRRPVFLAYLAAIFFTGALTLYFVYAGFSVVALDESKNPMITWIWVAFSVKTMLSFAAFSTFIIYFIRWESAWARQHADEELRTRARVIDIGRSSWLLESSRDAKDGVPSTLIKELSKNLFSHVPDASDGDFHPQALSDMLTQQLSSLRIKTADGTELEATRGKKGK